jgi:hypothetical protein
LKSWQSEEEEERVKPKEQREREKENSRGFHSIKHKATKNFEVCIYCS